MKLIVSRQAERQIDRLLASIYVQSPSGAARVQARLIRILDLLTVHPSAGRFTDRARVRRLPITPYPYLIFYRADEDAIVVLAVRHVARQPL